MAAAPVGATRGAAHSPSAVPRSEEGEVRRPRPQPPVAGRGDLLRPRRRPTEAAEALRRPLQRPTTAGRAGRHRLRGRATRRDPPTLLSAITRAAGTGASGGVAGSAAAAETRSSLEALLPPTEVHLLRLSEESKQLTNELVDLRFKHYGLDDQAGKLRNEIEHLDVMISRAAVDREYLETHGSLPVPEPPMAEGQQAAATGGGGPA